MTAEQERFEMMYRAHVRSVLSFALSRTGPEEAKDVVAQTFMVAWRRATEVPDDPLPWLIGVARRTMADRRRADRRREALVARLTGALRTAPTVVEPDVPAQLDLQGSIGIALGLLRPADREILVLVAWDAFSVDQLAVALDCSKATASVRLHRARRRFSLLLADADGEESQVDEPKTRGALVPSMGEA